MPAVFEVAGDGTPLPLKVANNNTDPLSVSEYFSISNVHQTSLSIRDTAFWKDVKNDPVFRVIPDECELIPVDHILGNRDYLDVGAQDEAFDQEEGESNHNYQDSGSPSVGKHSDDDSFEAGDRDFNSDDKSIKIEQDQVTDEPCGKATMKQSLEMGESTEDRLARLGVTGQPKPVRAPARPYVQEDLPKVAEGPATHVTDSSQSPRLDSQYVLPIDATVNTADQDNSSPTDEQPVSEQQGYTDKYYGKDTNAVHHAFSDDAHHQSPRAGSEGSVPIPQTARPFLSRDLSRQYSQGQTSTSRPPPPPPPPPPTDKTSVYESIDNGPLPSEAISSYDRPSYSTQTDSSITNNGYHGNGNSVSPNPSSRYQSNSRKRSYSYSQREMSEDRGREPLRQVDDVTPKLKRRQPKVADAYRLSSHHFIVD